ncbi:MAG: lyase family protein [Desulfuromonadales bacterium]
MDETRIEKDSMGEMEVPAAALFGAQTARALENFPISGLRFPRPFIRALGMIKEHAARVNLELGLLDRERALAIMEAAEEVVKGDLDEHFVLDIFQTGSGTSTNMNANEVIANRAALLMGKEPGSKAVHPNDHVNCPGRAAGASPGGDGCGHRSQYPSPVRLQGHRRAGGSQGASLPGGGQPF